MLAVTVVGALLPTGAAGGATSPYGEVQTRYDEARAAASAVAFRYSQAVARLSEIGGDIEYTQSRIAAEQTRIAALRSMTRARAVKAYTSGGPQSAVVGSLIVGRDPLVAARRATLLEKASSKDRVTVGRLRAVAEDLAVHEKELDAKKAAQQRLLDVIKAEKADLDAKLAEAESAYKELQARFAREAAERAAAERAARLAEQLRQLQLSGNSPVNPGGGAFVCPVRGVFNNDFGAPRTGHTHQGIDIFAPYGTPIVAAKAGSIGFQSGGAGGNMAYLYANDGITYFHAHLSAFAGGPRTVGQGEVIGYVGTTGDVVGNAAHLHFEMRTVLGVINPFPTLMQYC